MGCQNQLVNGVEIFQAIVGKKYIQFSRSRSQITRFLEQGGRRLWGRSNSWSLSLMRMLRTKDCY